MKAQIKIKTNRIYFEQFETLGDEADVIEIKRAWESAIYKVIEAAGFEAETEIGVGYDPAVCKYVTVEAGDECDCENPSPDCDCVAKAEVPELIKLCERYGELIAERAVEAGYEAAAARSEEFIKRPLVHDGSEEATEWGNPDDGRMCRGTGGEYCL